MKRFNSVFWGLIIIIVGVIFLGNTFALWNVAIFFKGWWTLFIIIPSIYGLFKKEWISSFLGISIGTLLLLASLDVIKWSMVGKAFIPIVLIIVGLSLVFRPKVKNTKMNTKGLPEYVGVFSGNEVKEKDKFTGASLVAVFGGVTFDLREAKIEEDVVIDCVSVFGGIDVIVPNNVKVKTTGVPLFGGAEDKSLGKEGPTVLVNYVCVFGGVDIK